MSSQPDTQDRSDPTNFILWYILKIKLDRESCSKVVLACKEIPFYSDKYKTGGYAFLVLCDL